jgi:hypothetical protein
MNKKYIAIVAAVVVVLLAGVSFMVLGKKQSNTAASNKTELPTNSEVVPTVDSSVKVTVEPTDASKHTIALKVNGLPNGTETLEYELTYDTKAQGLQGIVPDPVNVKGKTSFEKDILLGTESSGAKTYHEVVGPIKVSLKFTGSYGAKSFEKDFEL